MIYILLLIRSFILSLFLRECEKVLAKPENIKNDRRRKICIFLSKIISDIEDFDETFNDDLII